MTLREKVSIVDKAIGSIGAYVLPAGLLTTSLGLHNIDRDDVLTIIFTSGSTGTPKGVMLTHANVVSNVEAINQVIHLVPNDVIIGVLPFFHSFGFTITLCCVMSLNIKGIYHFNPLDARQIGKLCKRHRGTILLSTPTFLRSYLRRCQKEDLASLDTVVAGAEKLAIELCDAFEEKFAVRPVEGYGTTELSPLVSVNVPPSRVTSNHQEVQREGSVGRCIPGVSAKIVHVDNGQELSANEEGLLLCGRRQCDERLSQCTRQNGRSPAGWLVRHGRHGENRRRRIQSTSRAVRAGSQRSVAKWCRISRLRKYCSKSSEWTKSKAPPWQ